jgi:hypothetical protein
LKWWPTGYRSDPRLDRSGRSPRKDRHDQSLITEYRERLCCGRRSAASGRGRNAMVHYVGVLLPLESGGWRVLFPDVPSCEIVALSLEGSVFRAKAALASHVAGLNGSAVEILPRPRDLTAIRSDTQWAAVHAIKWPSTVITMIPVNI